MKKEKILEILKNIDDDADIKIEDSSGSKFNLIGVYKNLMNGELIVKVAKYDYSYQPNRLNIPPYTITSTPYSSSLSANAGVEITTGTTIS